MRSFLTLALTVHLMGSPAVAEHIRVDQSGFAPGESKHAFLMTSGPRGRFTVVGEGGTTVLSGTAGRDLGRWNAAYPHVYELDLTRLKHPGTYRIKSGHAESPPFRVGEAGGDAADKVVGFLRGQRDGGRRHANDRAAGVYDWPEFTGPDTDEVKAAPKRIGGPVDVEGGWFDAGDYLKFTHILAYVDTLLWASLRDAGPGGALRAEAAHGLTYLDKMWDGKTLYIQVGIGAGDKAGTFVGDHDVWRLPESDDRSPHRFLSHRPVFRAAPPGKPISPNLAGRTAAAFALAAQVEPDLGRAAELLEKGASVYALARTEHVGRLTTSLPYSFYPETAWRDDMELGGAELALAARRLGDGRADGWLDQAAGWAASYLEHEAGGDTFNLYDVSALAHADLIAAMGDGVPGLAVTREQLVGDLRAQLEVGAARAAKDPFLAGAAYDAFDAVPHAFGLAATARLYGRASGDRSFEAFGTRQRGWVFGANAWGVSFVSGVGRDAIRCPHYQISNITGRPATGAVVNGPNQASLFDEGLGDHLDGMKPCGTDGYAPFTGHGSRFVDDVRSWQASEPADDFAAIAIYALRV